MNAFAVIGFWAAVVGGVLMYLIAGREVIEALRELLKKSAPGGDDGVDRARLGHLATAFLGRPIAVVPGVGVTIDRDSGRPICIAVPPGANPADSIRHLAIQAGRLAAGGYEALHAVADPDRFATAFDRRLLPALIDELPGAPWSESDRSLAVDVPWKLEQVETIGRTAEARAVEKSRGLEQREHLHREAPKRLTKESEEERQGIFFIRFESIQEWTEDYLDLDRPAEDDGSSEGLQNTGAITRKATTSKTSSVTRREALHEVSSDAMMLPEWDEARGAYRPAHCRVTVQPAWEPGSKDAAEEMRSRLAKEAKRIERELELLTFHRRVERRTSSGSEVDLDAWVRFRADLIAGASCDASRLYRTTKPARRELTVGTLVDLSASTETPCGGRRVVDVERDAVYLLSRAVEALGDAHAAWGFTSQGASQVCLFELKRFDESLAAAEQRLSGLGPYANTRMGAAIRRAVPELLERGGAGRLLFVLTDGKPHDDDGYAGSYAFADTRRAIEEARARGVRVVGIGIGPDAQEGVRSLFAPYFVSVERIESLPRTLASLYVKVAGHGAKS